MFRRIDASAPRDAVSFSFDGREVHASAGDSVAAALLAADIIDFRDTPVSGSARGPYCMMGVCFDCLVEIDGLANCQACMTAIAPGMKVRRQTGATEVSDANEI